MPAPDKPPLMRDRRRRCVAASAGKERIPGRGLRPSKVSAFRRLPDISTRHCRQEQLQNKKFVDCEPPLHLCCSQLLTIDNKLRCFLRSMTPKSEALAGWLSPCCSSAKQLSDHSNEQHRAAIIHRSMHERSAEKKVRAKMRVIIFSIGILIAACLNHGGASFDQAQDARL